MKRGIRIIALVLVLLMADVSIASGDSLPNEAFISGFVGHAQSYAIDCEVRSAVDWAFFWGVSIGETEFLQALPRADNPDKGFVGDPNDMWGRIPPYGYGVHADPIAKALQNFGLQAQAVHGYSWDELREEIDAGRPVIVWIIGAMWEGTPVYYAASDGSISRVAAYEHTMTLVGYTPDTVKVVDSASGQLDTYRLDDFLTSWAVLGNMAVVGASEAEHGDLPLSHAERVNANQGMPQTAGQTSLQGTALNAEPQSDQHESEASIRAAEQGLNQSLNRSTSNHTYTVERGDYVMKLARRFGVSWLELARLNGLYAPYIIYPGQVLRLPETMLPEAAPEPTETSDTTSANSFMEYLLIAQHRETISRRQAVETNLSAAGFSTLQAGSHQAARLVLGNGMVLEVSRLARLNSLRPSYILFSGRMLGLH